MAMVFLGGAFGVALIEFAIRAVLIRRARRRAAFAGKSE
jgi:hypothetical protein